jgi:hypothetical protein
VEMVDDGNRDGRGNEVEWIDEKEQHQQW